MFERKDSNVCVAYSITSAYKSNGVCITTSGAPVKLSSAYTETLVSANGQVVLDANGEKAFIDFLGFSTCSGGGENVNPTALIQVLNTTISTTSTFSNVPLAAASATLTIAPVSSCRLLAMIADVRISCNMLSYICGQPSSAYQKRSTRIACCIARIKVLMTNSTISAIYSIYFCLSRIHYWCAIDPCLSFSCRAQDCYWQQHYHTNAKSNRTFYLQRYP